MNACLALAAGVLLALAGPAAAATPRVAAVARAAAADGGWGEVTITLDNGPRAWRGTLGLAADGAKLLVGVSMEPHGRRVLDVPFWWPSPDRAPRLRVDDAAGPPVARAARGTEGVLRVTSAGELPATWRALDGTSTVVLPAAERSALTPLREAALERWVRWGGVLTIAGTDRAPMRRPLGLGALLLGGADAPGEAGRPAPAAEAAARAAQRWDRAGIAQAGWRDDGARPGGGLALAVAAHVAVLGLAGIGVARATTLRRVGALVVVLAAAGGTSAAWWVARAGGAGVEIRESALVRALPDGHATHVSALVRLDARRRATVTVLPAVAAALVYEVELQRDGGDPQRALRHDADGGGWNRALALGERAVLRVDGLGPDLGLRVRREAGGWLVVNGGPHTLREIDTGEALVARPALAPGETLRVERRALALHATLDPPLAIVDVPGGARAETHSRLYLVLADLEASS